MTARQSPKPAQPLAPRHRGVGGRGRREHEERRLSEAALLCPELGTLAEDAAIGLLADEADRAGVQLPDDRLEPPDGAGEVSPAEVTRAGRRPMGGVGDAEPQLEQLELLARREKTRGEAGSVQKTPEVVAGIREVGSCGGGGAAGIDPAEDCLEAGRKDVRDVRLRLLQALGRRSSLRKAPGGARRRRWSGGGCGAGVPLRPERTRRVASRSTWRSIRPR